MEITVTFDEYAAKALDHYYAIDITEFGSWSRWKEFTFRYKTLQGHGSLADIMKLAGFLVVSTRRPRRGELYLLPTGKRGGWRVMLAHQNGGRHAWPIVVNV